MSFVDKIPYSLRRVFAEVANIPTAVGYLPCMAFAKDDDSKQFRVGSTAVATVALTAGLVFMPPVVALFGLPLMLFGRACQWLNQENPPPAHKILKVKP